MTIIKKKSCKLSRMRSACVIYMYVYISKSLQDVFCARIYIHNTKHLFSFILFLANFLHRKCVFSDILSVAFFAFVYILSRGNASFLALNYSAGSAYKSLDKR